MSAANRQGVVRRTQTPAEAFKAAVALHRRGRVGEAEQTYLALLHLINDHVGALHNLGVIRLGQGRPDEAIDLLSRASGLDPDAAAIRNDLGMALALCQRYDEAIVQYDKALAIRPDFAGARGNLANALVAVDRAPEAIAQLEQALIDNPDSPQLRNNLGNALAALNRHEEAIARYLEALAINPGFAEAHNNIGIAFASLGRIAQSIAHYEQAIALRPDYVDAVRNLGRALLARGRAEAALPYLRRVVELSGDAQAHNDLGNGLVMLDRQREAIEHCRKALAAVPGYAAARNDLGNALSSIGQHEDALAEFRAALAVQPDYPEAHGNLGHALLALHRAEEAIDCFNAVLATKPDMAQAHHGIGGASQALGRLEASREAFERAVALAPGNGSYYQALAAARRFTRGDKYLVAMEAMARDRRFAGPEQRIALHFALGKAYADIGEHELAFSHYLEGNTAQRRCVDYDEAATLASLERLKAVFTADLVRERRGAVDPSDVPVFIVGMPRSGTTLVEQILASHPAIFGGGERREMGLLAATIRRGDGTPGFPYLVPSFTDQQLHALGTRYLADLTRLAPSALRITDKMPGNFHFAGLIQMILPHARIIHVQRDTVDTCLSCFTHLFAGELTWSNDLGEIGRAWRAYSALMAHWRGAAGRCHAGGAIRGSG